MFQNILKMMHTKIGRILISIILGIGLASLFRKSCEERNCIIFKAPPLEEVVNDTYSYNDKCYTFKEKAMKCGNNMKQVHFA